MIVTLTPNPSLDLLFEAEELRWDDANRLAPPRRRAGGQGINVARAARVLGGRSIAVAPLGGATGLELRSMLEGEGTGLRAVPIRGETRVFVGVREHATGRSLLLNPRGPEISPEERVLLLGEVSAALSEERPAWIACCGSLPPGLEPAFYAAVGELAREHGAAFVPDCDGEALRLAAERGCDLLVPNAHEASRLLGRDVADVEAAGDAAAALRSFAPIVAVTLGEGGAVCATAGERWHAAAPRHVGGSAVGAGDAFLAAFLLARCAGAEAPEALRAAVAAGTAVLLGRGADLLRREDLEAVSRAVTLRRLG
ncbi:MAG TPA: hexose kinase [Longimicrobiales bacterium]|nr:hexose kinase [Longimicrobiales bacterium]